MPNPTESSYIFSIAELVEFLDQYEQENSPFSKEAIAVSVKNRFVLSQNRSVYYNKHFAIRFSTASGSSFSNTVLGLATLRRYSGSHASEVHQSRGNTAVRPPICTAPDR